MRFTIDDKHLIKWMWVKKIRRKNACSQCFWQKIKSLWWGKDTQYVHNMSPFISSSGLSPGSCEAKVQRAKVCLNCTEPSAATSSCWSLPVGGTCRIHAARTWWWSLRGELRAIWPKSRRRLLVTRWESGEQPVVLLTSAFDTWRVYGILESPWPWST